MGFWGVGLSGLVVGIGDEVEGRSGWGRCVVAIPIIIEPLGCFFDFIISRVSGHFVTHRIHELL